jgi:hypothetical protein
MKKYKPNTPAWERKANSIARSWAPPIRPCKTCGYPVVDGYCCNNCGCIDPGNSACDCHPAPSDPKRSE